MCIITMTEISEGELGSDDETKTVENGNDTIEFENNAHKKQPVGCILPQNEGTKSRKEMDTLIDVTKFDGATEIFC